MDSAFTQKIHCVQYIIETEAHDVERRFPSARQRTTHMLPYSVVDGVKSETEKKWQDFGWSFVIDAERNSLL